MNTSDYVRGLLLALFALAGTQLSAQSGFSYSREIPYPTEFDVRQNNVDRRVVGNGGASARVANPPIVVPGGFKTRKTGSSVQIQHVGVRGTVTVANSADGRELVTLQPEGASLLRVATGSRFTWNGHILHAQGWKGDEYIVVDLSARRSYAFARK